MYHALLDFQGWEKREDSQGNGADLNSYPTSLQRLHGHGSAVLILRGTAGPTSISRLGNYQPRTLWFQNIMLAGLVLLGFSWR